MELVTIEVKLPKEVYDSASEILAKQGLTIRVHFEWVYDGDFVYLVQADEEELAKGLNPTKVNSNLEKENIDTVGFPHCLRPLKVEDVECYRNYAKIQNPLLYRRLELSTAPLYIFEKTVTVHTLKDLDELERLKEAPSSNIRNIQIQPTDATFLRDRRIIDRIGIVAKELGATILLEGGTLSHAYYQLTRTGAKVEVRYYFEKRQAVEFNKLVRDKIPEKIEKNGEEAIMAELDKKLFSSLLKRKLVEEALEVLDSENDENIVASFKIRRSQQSQFCHHSVRIPHKAV